MNRILVSSFITAIAEERKESIESSRKTLTRLNADEKRIEVDSVSLFLYGSYTHARTTDKIEEKERERNEA